MPSFREVYARHAAGYDALVSREDHAGALTAALRDLLPPGQPAVVDFGSGTGRVARLLAPHARAVLAADASHHMLGLAARRQPAEHTHVAFAAARNHALPLPAGWADLAIEGWSFAHAVGWYPESWQARIGAMLAEMVRVTRPGGRMVLIETLGTGVETPAPPTDGLAALYDWWEREHGFTRTWVRTDYRFESAGEAERLTRFFFGDELAARARRDALRDLPECTGIWVRER